MTEELKIWLSGKRVEYEDDVVLSKFFILRQQRRIQIFNYKPFRNGL